MFLRGFLAPLVLLQQLQFLTAPSWVRNTRSGDNILTNFGKSFPEFLQFLSRYRCGSHVGILIQQLDPETDSKKTQQIYILEWQCSRNEQIQPADKRRNLTVLTWYCDATCWSSLPLWTFYCWTPREDLMCCFVFVAKMSEHILIPAKPQNHVGGCVWVVVEGVVTLYMLLFHCLTKKPLTGCKKFLRNSKDD